MTVPNAPYAGAPAGSWLRLRRGVTGRRWRLRVIGASLLCGVAIGVAVALTFRGPDPPSSPLRGPRFPPALPAADFTLTDQDGRRVSLHQYRHEVVVVAFLSTTCAGPCRTVAAELRHAVERMDRRPALLAVSVDPARDTARRARMLLRRIGLGKEMRFLLGSEAELRPVWRSYALAAGEIGRSGTAFVIVVDAVGRLRLGYPAARFNARDLVHDVAVLRRERYAVAS
jgi:protein SCO1/2